jgi:hypothetical protein
MSDTLPDDAWINAFLPTPPRPLLIALQRRLQASTTHVNALSELYKQRAAIEAQYAESLSKLARAAESGGLNGKNGIEWDRANGEGKLWDSVISEISEVRFFHRPACAFLTVADINLPLDPLCTPSNRLRAAYPGSAEQDRSLASDRGARLVPGEDAEGI